MSLHGLKARATRVIVNYHGHPSDFDQQLTQLRDGVLLQHQLCGLTRIKQVSQQLDFSFMAKLFYTFLLCMFFVRCSVCLPVVGYVIEHATRDSQAHPRMEKLANLNCGQRVKITDLSRKTFEGFYRGIRLYSVKTYHSMYEEYLQSAGSINLPDLDSTVEIAMLQNYSLKLILCGFDFEVVLVKPEQNSEMIQLKVEEIFSISSMAKGEVNLDQLDVALKQLKVPTYSYVEITDFNRIKKISLYNIDKIEMSRSTKYIGILMGAGLIIDFIIGMTIGRGLSDAFESMGH